MGGSAIHTDYKNCVFFRRDVWVIVLAISSTRLRILRAKVRRSEAEGEANKQKFLC
nr:hypothetical protein [Cressdnaviricota sp.]